MCVNHSQFLWAAQLLTVAIYQEVITNYDKSFICNIWYCSQPNALPGMEIETSESPVLRFNVYDYVQLMGISVYSLILYLDYLLNLRKVIGMYIVYNLSGPRFQ